MKRYWWLVCVLIFSPLALSQQETPEVMPALALTESTIGYARVQEAFEELSTDPDATQNEFDGWTIFQQKIDAKYVIRSLILEDHLMHPSMVHREAVKNGAEVNITMGVLCHSSRFDCDQLIEQFNVIDQNVKRKLSRDASS